MKLHRLLPKVDESGQSDVISFLANGRACRDATISVVVSKNRMGGRSETRMQTACGRVAQHGRLKSCLGSDNSLVI